MERILIVEDDPAVQRALKRLFESENYTVEVRGDGNSAVEAFRAALPTAVVLDLRLPGLPGNDICREFKKIAPAVPVIVLSANTTVSDKVLLLEIGADDYVTKPFSPRELLARVRAASRRASHSDPAEVFSFDDVSVDFAKMELVRGDQPITITAQEFKLLKYFARNPQRVLSRSELLDAVWGYENYPSTRTVDNHVWKLRLKLEREPSNPGHFLTVHGAGYKFVP